MMLATLDYDYAVSLYRLSDISMAARLTWLCVMVLLMVKGFMFLL